MRARRTLEIGQNIDVGVALRLLASGGLCLAFLMGAGGGNCGGPLDVGDGQCSSGLTLCDGGCADLSADSSNCGSCGTACSSSEACRDGSCTPVINCATACGGVCVDFTSDPAHCGSCDNACTSAQTCQQGVCTNNPPVCPSGECDGRCVDLTTDPDNCSACGAACQLGQECLRSTCVDAGGPAYGSVCDPTAQPDPCLAGGMVCVSGEGPAYCLPPFAGARCLPEFGCNDPSLACLPGTSFGPTTDDSVFSCYQACASQDDCADPNQTCTLRQGRQVCAPVYCGPGIDQASYLASCGAGAGTCLPMSDGVNAYGICRLDGTAGIDQPCSLRRTAGDSDLCGAGTVCNPLDYFAFCSPAFLEGDGGTDCPSGYLGATLTYPEAYGVCFEECADGGVACPDTLTCQPFASGNAADAVDVCERTF